MKDLTEFVTKAINGDMEAFEELYTRTYKQVYFTCMTFLKNEQDASDISQEVYVTAMQNISTLKDAERFESWIGKLAVNKCINSLKKKKAFPVEDEVIEEWAEGSDELLLPEEYVVQEEKRKILQGIIKETLSETLYQTVVLYYFQNMPVNEIAELMECPVSTVTARLSKARNKIKEAVLGYEEKSGNKLHGLALVPILAMLFRTEAEASEPVNVWAKVRTMAPARKLPVEAVKTGGKVMLNSLKAKILVAVLALVLVGGTIAAVVVSNNAQNKDNDKKNESVKEKENEESREDLFADEIEDSEEHVAESDEFEEPQTEESVEIDEPGEPDYYAMAENILDQIDVFFTALISGDAATVLAMGYEDSEVYEDLAKMCEHDCTTQFLQTIYGDVKHCINEETVEDLAWNLQIAYSAGGASVSVPMEYSVPLMMIFDKMYYATHAEGEEVAPSSQIVAKVVDNEEAFPIIESIMKEVPMVRGTGFYITLPDENGDVKIVLDPIMESLEMDDLVRIDERYPARFLCEQLDLLSDAIVGPGNGSFYENGEALGELDSLLKARDFAGFEACLSSLTGEDYAVKYGDKYGHYADLTEGQKAFVDAFVKEEVEYDLVDYVITEDNNHNGRRFGTFILTFPVLNDREQRDVSLADWYNENDIMEYSMVHAGVTANPKDFENMLYLYYTVIQYAGQNIE